jgi:ribosomal protein S18 acetylase RimI-like enzyme
MLPTIRDADFSDLHEASMLWVDMVHEELGPDVHPDVEEWRSVVTVKFLTNAHFRMLVARDNNKLVGFIMGEAGYNPTDSKIHGLSQTIYVIPEYRNKNVGLHLYHNLAKRLIRDGATIIGFNCVADKIEFWRKKGYECLLTVMCKNVPDLVRALGISG